MNTALSLPNLDDLDSQMVEVARHIAQDIYPLEDILKNMSISLEDFNKWKNNPRFHEYIKEEKAQWSSAFNATTRTKLKAAIVLERFMETLDSDLGNKVTPLNQRVEGAKLLAKITGLGEPKNAVVTGGGGFQLHINIGSGAPGVTINTSKVIEHQEEEEDGPDIFPMEADDYDPFISPDTLGDE
jgi:hypothetical protein